MELQVYSNILRMLKHAFPGGTFEREGNEMTAILNYCEWTRELKGNGFF